MSNDNNSADAANYDAIWASTQPDNSHLIGMSTLARTNKTVTSNDYDNSRAPQRAISMPPGTPPVAQGGTNLDMTDARSQVGERVTDASQLTEDSIVRFGGTESTVGVLQSLGLIARGPDGIFRAVAANPGQAQQQQQQQNTPPPLPVMDGRSEAIMADVMAKAPGQATGAAVNFIEGNGVASDESVEQLASSMGIEPHVVRERIAHVSTGFAKEAARSGAKAAQCGDEVAADALEWARTARPADLRQTAQRHYTEGKGDYKPLVVDYLASLDQRDPNRILSANPVPGRKTRWDGTTRQVIVTLQNGTEVSWATAVKQGLISMR